MSNSNDSKQISSNVSCNSESPSSVESPININIINLTNIDANKTSTNNSISKTNAADKPCVSSRKNKTNTVDVHEEPNTSINQNAGASSDNAFSGETTEIVENVINFLTTNGEDEDNKNTVIRQDKYVSDNHPSTVNSGITSEDTATASNTNHRTNSLQLNNLNTNDGRFSVERVNQTISSFSETLYENRLQSAGGTPILEGHQNGELQIIPNVCLQYQPTDTRNRSTERRRRPEILHHTSGAVLLPRDSTNLPPYGNIGPAYDLREQDVVVNITPPPVPPRVIQGPPPIAGAPPTYSAVMRLGADDQCQVWTQSIRMQPSPPFIAPIPPPPYTEIQGIHTERPMLVASADQMVWGPDPMSVVCPRCANVVVTSTQSQRSNLTHFSALALCLCGCWPCCLLPYCMDSCKNTYHHCPTCQQFLGMYRPW